LRIEVPISRGNSVCVNNINEFWLVKLLSHRAIKACGQCFDAALSYKLTMLDEFFPDLFGFSLCLQFPINPFSQSRIFDQA